MRADQIRPGVDDQDIREQLCRDGDQAFQDAMRAAIRKKRENPPIGVQRKPGTSSAARIVRPVRVGYVSPALSCTQADGAGVP